MCLGQTAGFTSAEPGWQTLVRWRRGKLRWRWVGERGHCGASSCLSALIIFPDQRTSALGSEAIWHHSAGRWVLSTDRSSLKLTFSRIKEKLVNFKPKKCPFQIPLKQGRIEAYSCESQPWSNSTVQAYSFNLFWLADELKPTMSHKMFD